MHRVINIRKEVPDFYLGRAWAGHPNSPWANPFHIKNGDRIGAILNFAAYFYAPEQKWLREKALNEIWPNAMLGCWCAPLPCHADIVAGYLQWRRREIWVVVGKLLEGVGHENYRTDS